MGTGVYLLAVIFALWVGGPTGMPVAVAQFEEPTEAVSSSPAADISLEQLDRFVSAYLQVAELIEAQSESLQRAETGSELMEMQRKIQAEAFNLIAEAGLNRQDYWQLLGLANTDTDFRDRVLALIEERSP